MDHAICVKGVHINLNYDTKTHSFSVETTTKKWETDPDFKPYFVLSQEGKNHIVYFENATLIQSERFTTGVGVGISTVYENFVCEGKTLQLSFQTKLWIENGTSKLHFEVGELHNNSNYIFEKMMWPAPFEFKERDEQNYTLIPMMQGIMLPNNYEKEVNIVMPPSTSPIVFYERAAYMAWYSQISRGSGYIAIVETAEDAGYDLEHKKGGTTTIHMIWYHSMEKFSYRRTLTYVFLEKCDYNDICKEYRSYIKEKGLLVTLKEKLERTPKLAKLIGSPVIHTGILYNHEKGSAWYDEENPSSSYSFSSFGQKEKDLLKLKENGLKKAYLHLDGWGVNGYDHNHPDVLPPCEQAGGKEGMKALIKTCNENDITFAIHDQYRDYYINARTFNENQALITRRGKPEYENSWGGGEQTHLCSQLAPYYLHRNFTGLKNMGINLDGAYLDVFSVIALEECYSSEHKMSRSLCKQKRIECFNYVRAQGMIVSSEEPVEWAVPYLDLVHHAPFALAPNIDKGETRGYGVPLFNLVYHDCLIVPWSTTVGGWGIPDKDDGFLYALLYGGVGYLDIDAGKEAIEKNAIICKLHEQIATAEMVRHEFVDNNYRLQRGYYSNGIVVEVDFDKRTYVIKEN